jgi:hypothetical protein
MDIIKNGEVDKVFDILSKINNKLEIIRSDIRLVERSHYTTNEKALDYDRQLNDITNYFGNKRLLSITDVCKYLGIDKKAVHKRLNIDGKKGITTVVLARKLIEVSN